MERYSTKEKPLEKLSKGRRASVNATNRYVGGKTIGELVKAKKYQAVEVEKNVYILATDDGKNEWREIEESKAVARGLSAVMPGQFYYSGSHVVRVCGRTQEYIHSESSYNSLCSARQIAKMIGHEEGAKKNSCGSVGRSLIDYICGEDLNNLDPKFERSMSLSITKSPSWGYFVVKPGKYENMIHIDATAYYHSIAKRIRSCLPSFNLLDGRLTWRNSGKAAKRWQNVIDTIGVNKPLRNTFIGQLVSGSDSPGLDYFVGGDSRPIIVRPSKLAAVGHLIIRCGAEITQRTAIQLDSVYTCVDCAIVKDSLYAELGGTYWEKCGINVHRNGFGVADIRNLSNYAMQGHRVLRGDISTGEHGIPHEPAPKIQYHKEIFGL